MTHPVAPTDRPLPPTSDAGGNETPASTILAADVGGTYARIGLVGTSPDAHLPVRVLAYRSYRAREWPSLADILSGFLRDECRGQAAPGGCALAVAGYLRGDELVAENLAWPVRIRDLRERLGIGRLEIVNDFEALAYATRFLRREDAFDVIDAPGTAGISVVVGPGTGLGCAALWPAGERTLVLASEAGHAALAPGNERECEVLQRLARGRDYVHTGHVLSGPGLLNLYRALGDLDGLPAVRERPAEVSAAALAGHDALAREALAMFCALLGSFAGDFAITFKAAAGVFLAGGILPEVRDFLVTSDFRARFLNKGLMRPFLANVPVRLLEHGRLGVIGAAALVEARWRR